MRRIFVILALVGLMAGAAAAAPVGPGGRIYVTRYGTSSGVTDNDTQLVRIDVDKDWNVVVNYDVIATVKNSHDLNSNQRYVTSPEILHPRALGGDGSVFLAGYYDNEAHVRYYKVTDAGVVSVMHPGIGEDIYRGDGSAPYTGGLPSTGSGSSIFPVDVKGEVSGYEGAIFHYDYGTSWSNGYFADMNGNDDLTDNTLYAPSGGDSTTYPGYTYSGLGRDDAEIGGPPNTYDGTDNTIWAQGGYNLRRAYYDGSRWRTGTYYDFRNPIWYHNDNGPQDMSFLFRNNGIAVGDVDGDGVMDVFAMSTDPQGSDHNGATIVRMADLNYSNDIDDNVNDLFEIWYDEDTDSESLGGNYAYADLELVQDPDSGKWTLLVLQRTLGRLVAMELADNGEYLLNDGFHVILDNNVSLSGYGLYGMEFDADPLEAGPVPGDANGDGKVDGTDLAIWQQNYDPLGTGNATFATGDWNGDGKVDGTDLALWQQNYDPLGTGGLDGLGGSVPEPATLLLLGSGALAALGAARRRLKK